MEDFPVFTEIRAYKSFIKLMPGLLGPQLGHLMSANSHFFSSVPVGQVPASTAMVSEPSGTISDMPAAVRSVVNTTTENIESSHCCDGCVAEIQSMEKRLMKRMEDINNVQNEKLDKILSYLGLSNKS